MARPKKSADEKLTEIFPTFRMSLATRENLAKKAAAANISEVEFLRFLIDDAPLPASVSSGVADPALIVALNRIGNNVNQLARSVHRDSAFQNYWQEVGAELRTALAQVLDGQDA